MCCAATGNLISDVVGVCVCPCACVCVRVRVFLGLLLLLPPALEKKKPELTLGHRSGHGELRGVNGAQVGLQGVYLMCTECVPNV